MARRLRIDPEGGIHHVYTRGTNRWVLFHDDPDRRKFVGTLDLVCDRYEVEVLAFCLMDNHIHLLLRCPNGSLSDAMRDLKSIYAAWFRLRHGSTGPIFDGRFGSKPVTDWKQLKTVIRYIHRNPYSISPTLELGAYPWSSHGMYLGSAAAPVWMNLELCSPLFSDYQSEIESPIASDKVQNRRPRASSGSASVRVPSVRVPGTRTLPGSRTVGIGRTGRIGLAEILVAVAQVARVAVAEVHPSRRNGLIGCALVLARDEGGYSFSEMAEPFGYRTADAARIAMRRMTPKLTADDTLRMTLEAARQRIRNEAA